MNPSRFDQWTRTAGTGSRRSALRGLLALGAAALIGRRDVAAGTRCFAWGCPCINDGSCTDGLVCCGNMCITSGECGISCVATGGACPSGCALGDDCPSCCGGFCAAYGGCVDAYAIGAPGDSCDVTNQGTCGVGLSCCPIGGWDYTEGVCDYGC
jgi:hypothetical protein